YYYFFQAEDGIRDRNVTGVQTCALPIWRSERRKVRGGQQQGLRLGENLPPPGETGPSGRVPESAGAASGLFQSKFQIYQRLCKKIGRASCREREPDTVGRRE